MPPSWFKASARHRETHIFRMVHHIRKTDSISSNVVACIFSVTELCTCGDKEIE